MVSPSGSDATMDTVLVSFSFTEMSDIAYMLGARSMLFTVI